MMWSCEVWRVPLLTFHLRKNAFFLALARKRRAYFRTAFVSYSGKRAFLIWRVTGPGTGFLARKASWRTMRSSMMGICFVCPEKSLGRDRKVEIRKRDAEQWAGVSTVWWCGQKLRTRWRFWISLGEVIVKLTRWERTPVSSCEVLF